MNIVHSACSTGAYILVEDTDSKQVNRDVFLSRLRSNCMLANGNTRYKGRDHVFFYSLLNFQNSIVFIPTE